MNVRSALSAPFRLSLIDLLAAVAIAVIAFGLVIGPAMAQDPSPSVEPTATTEASPEASLLADPSPSALASPQPAATPSLAPGSNSNDDPCGPKPTPDPAATPNPEPTDAPPDNLCPASPSNNPMDVLAWIFTPIFQAIFLGLAFIYSITGDIGISIILLTILLRILLIPVFRAQIVSQRRMQMLQPEIRAIQTKYKGDRQKISAEQMQLYKDRGVNPASGCLPAVLQLFLLLPMYQVFMRGLTAPDISAMLNPFGLDLVNVECYNPTDPYAPCIDPAIPWLSWLPKIDGGFIVPGYPGGLPSNEPEIFLMVFGGLGLGLSLLASFSAVMQLIQSRMMMNRNIAPGDSTAATTNRMMLLLPLFSLIYGAILPAGLFIYWITTSIFSIVQQFMINGYGGLFPLFGWTPGFAKDFKAPFPVSMPEPKAPEPDKDGKTPTTTTKRSTKDSAAGTIRPARRRSRRRGRRR